jgi:hypothetical protein
MNALAMREIKMLVVIKAFINVMIAFPPQSTEIISKNSGQGTGTNELTTCIIELIKEIEGGSAEIQKSTKRISSRSYIASLFILVVGFMFAV